MRRFTILYFMLLPAALLANPQQRPLPQQQTQMDASVSIFTVLAAVNAAGYDAEIDSVSNHPLRKMLRDHLAAQKIQSVAELKRFVRDHRRKDPG